MTLESPQMIKIRVSYEHLNSEKMIIFGVLCQNFEPFRDHSSLPAFSETMGVEPSERPLTNLSNDVRITSND